MLVCVAISRSRSWRSVSNWAGSFCGTTTVTDGDDWPAGGLDAAGAAGCGCVSPGGGESTASRFWSVRSMLGCATLWCVVTGVTLTVVTRTAKAATNARRTNRERRRLLPPTQKLVSSGQITEEDQTDITVQ
jgi:hypothetical protein